MAKRTSKQAAPKFPKHMSAEQRLYVVALAQRDTLKAAHADACKAAGFVWAEEMSDEEFDRVFNGEEDLAESMGLREAEKVLKMAEDAMVRWSCLHSITRYPAHAETVFETYVNAQGSVKFWPRMVDIASRLDATR
jgi:hypothetical protein